MMRTARTRIWRIAILAVISAARGRASLSDSVVPEALNLPAGHQRFEGSVNVQCLVIMGWPAFRQPAHWFKAPLLKEGVERTLTKAGLFSKIEQGPADYVLDIWLDECDLHRPGMGIGEFQAKVIAIWRLTRASDGRVLFCEREEGCGSRRKAGFGPGQKSMLAALGDMIQKGVVAIGDAAAPHLAAAPEAGHRPGIRPWIEHVRRNWAQLRKGMTLEEVEKAIGPVREGGAILSSVAVEVDPSIAREDPELDIAIWANQAGSDGEVILRRILLRMEISNPDAPHKLGEADSRRAEALVANPRARLFAAGALVTPGREVGQTGNLVRGVANLLPQYPRGSTVTRVDLEWISNRHAGVSPRDYQFVSGFYTLDFVDNRLAGFAWY